MSIWPVVLPPMSEDMWRGTNALSTSSPIGRQANRTYPLFSLPAFLASSSSSPETPGMHQCCSGSCTVKLLFGLLVLRPLCCFLQCCLLKATGAGRSGWRDPSNEHHDPRAEPPRRPCQAVVRPAGAVVPGPGVPRGLLCCPAADSDHPQGEAALSIRHSHRQCHQNASCCARSG